MKRVQTRSFFLSVFSCIRTEYGDLRSKSPYSDRIQENTDQKKLRIWTLFTQCLRKKKANFIGRYGEGAEKASEYRKIDVTSKTPIKTEAIVTEISLYDHKVDEDFIFVSIEEEGINTLKNAQKRSGLQDTILGQKLMFKERNRKFVQILHNGSFHWMTVSNINSEKNEINYYDSLFHGKIKDHIRIRVWNLY